MWNDAQVEVTTDYLSVAKFLAEFNLAFDAESDLTVEIKEAGRIVATGSLRGNVLQCFAVSPKLRGEGYANRIVDYLVQSAFERGRTQVFVFTAPQNSALFRGMGFKTLAETSWAVLLESGYPTIEDYLKQLSAYRQKIQGRKIGGLVMNCNPFTLGHQYLVKQAAAECDHVYLLVVEEDRSVFPFSVRFELVKQGTAHLPNVTVLPSGPYAVSLATFPSYFSAEETAHARAGASVDATVYGKYIAQALGIDVRFVGTEPYSPVTNIYNETLREVLQSYNVLLKEVKRFEQGGKPVSASLVRRALRSGDYSLLTNLVPASTLEFLLSPRAEGIINRLKAAESRH